MEISKETIHRAVMPIDGRNWIATGPNMRGRYRPYQATAVQRVPIAFNQQ